MVAWHRRGGFALWRCGGCQNGFLAEADVPADLEARYSAEYFEGASGARDGATGYPSYRRDAAVMRRNFERRLAWIESFARPGRVLDVGAAYGHFLGVARERGWQAEGVEIAAEVIPEAESLSGAQIHAGDFLKVELAGPYDVITFFDVIEHMRDPGACLGRARELLSPEGWIVIETGDLASPWARLLGRHWYFLDPPQHLSYFSRAGLEAMLRKQGIAGSIRGTRPSKSLSLENIAFKMSVLAPGAWVRGAAGWVAGRRPPGAVRLNFGDDLLLAARGSDQD